MYFFFISLPLAILAVPIPESAIASASTAAAPSQSCMSHHESEQLVSSVSYLSRQWSNLVSDLDSGISDSNVDALDAVLDNINTQIESIKGNYSGKSCLAAGVKSDDLKKHTDSLLDVIESHIPLFASVIPSKGKSGTKVIAPSTIASVNGVHSNVTTSLQAERSIEILLPSAKDEHSNVQSNANTGGYKYQGGQDSDDTSPNEDAPANQQAYGNQYSGGYYGYQQQQQQPYYYYGYQYPSYQYPSYQYPNYQPAQQPAAQNPGAPRVGGTPGTGAGGSNGYPAPNPAYYPPPQYPAAPRPPAPTPTPTGYHGGIISRVFQFGHRLVEMLVKQVEDIGIIFVIDDDQDGTSKANSMKEELLHLADSLL